jgi:hypothetical protein
VVPDSVQATAGHARALEATGAGWGCVGIACLGSWYSASLVCVCCVRCWGWRQSWGTRGAVGLAVRKGVAVTAGFVKAVGGTEDIMRVPEVAWMLRGGWAVCAPDAARAVGVEQGGFLQLLECLILIGQTVKLI